MRKSGFIAVIGRPNAGKSTLVNALVKEKIAITSPKAQTTRDNIMGILSDDEAQLVLIDTPGIHKPQHQLGKQLNRNAYQALSEADLIYWIVDATQSYGKGDAFLLERLQGQTAPILLLVNKIDLLSKERLLQVLSLWQNRFAFARIIPVSALKQDNLNELLKISKQYLQAGVSYFPDTMITDHDERFQIGELIREKVLYKTEEEIPHSVAVVIEDMQERENCFHIQALVIVERASQKGILIGKQGAMIRSIRLAAQKELKQKLGKRTELELYVRVEPNWRNRTSKLTMLGYHND